MGSVKSIAQEPLVGKLDDEVAELLDIENMLRAIQKVTKNSAASFFKLAGLTSRFFIFVILFCQTFCIKD